MKTSSVVITAATFVASFVSLSSAFAETVRDHRGGPVVRDHRTVCVIGDPNCRDHREPIVVVPPRHLPEPPVVIVDPIRPRPHPPIIVVDPMPTGGHDWHDQGDNFGISCKMGRNILRQNGYRHVQAYDCQGQTYGYFASKRHQTVKVKMNLRGDIISVQRVRF